MYPIAMNFKLTEDNKRAFSLVNDTENNVFITGKAGTGKSALLQYILKKTKKDVVVLAPTGVAALNIGGETIHSFFRFSIGVDVDEAKHKGAKVDRKRFKKLQTIIIDEISMVRSDLLDCINVFLQYARENDLPFGGVQVIFIGDLYQLPPVVTPPERSLFYDRSPYFFSSEVFQHPDFYMDFCELQTMYRQTDQKFINILNAVRNKTCTKEDLAVLNTRVGQAGDDHSIYLTSTNALAQQVNDKKLAESSEIEIEFEAEVTGNFKAKQSPTEKFLLLKRGAQVMFLNNDTAGRWVNGSLGTIKKISPAGIWVELFDGGEEFVTKHSWDMYHYVYNEEQAKLTLEILGSFQQIPVKLAWAVTIHKSQGKTFSSVVIDLGNGSFAHGQTYVALSRCVSLEGISLKNPIRPSDIRLDYRVVDFLKKCQT